jgi:hypothetical protein
MAATRRREWEMETTLSQDYQLDDLSRGKDSCGASGATLDLVARPGLPDRT